MASHKNFQSVNIKNSKDRYDFTNPAFESNLVGHNAGVINDMNLHKWAELISFLRWYPDIAYDLIAPKDGKKKLELDIDQRITLRTLVRFPEDYLCVIRGYGKTMLHIMAQYHVARFFPAISLSITASTKESAVSIWEDKHNEILEFYPALKDEIKTARFSKDTGYVEWVNGSWMDALANTQQSKGKRRRRGGLEESNLIDKDVLEDAVLPIFNIPRRTLGNIIDPEELNGQVNRYTTSGYKNSNEYDVIRSVYDKMVDLKGGFIIGADWRLPVYFGRQKMSTIISAREGSITSFKQNYLCEWIGALNGAMINLNKLMNCRQIDDFQLENPKDKKGNNLIKEYVICSDIARSASDANNQTAIIVLEIIRNNKNKIKSVDLVYIDTPSNGLNFSEQAIEIKKVWKKFGGNLDETKSNVKAIVIDANGIGKGVQEKMLEDQGEEYPAFNTINTDEKSDSPENPKIVYSLKSQSLNKEIVTKFVDYIESKKLRLMKQWNELKPENQKYDKEEQDKEVMCDQTRKFIDQVANLKYDADKGKTTQVVKKIDKDIYSAVSYAIYYIDNFMEQEEDDDDYDYVFDTMTV